LLLITLGISITAQEKELRKKERKENPQIFFIRTRR